MTTNCNIKIQGYHVWEFLSEVVGDHAHTSARLAPFVDGFNSDRFTVQGNADLGGAEWADACIYWHCCEGSAVCARHRLDEQDVPWVAVWDDAECSDGEPWGHATVCAPRLGETPNRR